MLYFDRSDVSKGIRVNKTSKSKECAILKIKNADYCCIITGISESEAIRFFENINLTEKC